MTIGRLLIRADVGADVGAGHLMRCLALGERWIECGGDVTVVVSADIPDGLASRAASIGAEVERLPAGAEDADWLLERAGTLGARWVVIDGYRFDERYLTAVSRAGTPVLAIDDDARHKAYPTRMILNQNLHAKSEAYAGKSDAPLLLGPRYTLIRSEFRRAGDWERHVSAVVGKVLVTLGGADPGGHTGRLIEAFSRLADRDQMLTPSIRVVVGPANPLLEFLHGIVADRPDIELLSNVLDMGEQMRWCDLAISAAGSTVWELALFGTPMMLATASEVEEPVARSLAEIGAALHLGRLADLDIADLSACFEKVMPDAALRKGLGDAAAGLVDGQGARRVVDQMLAISSGSA